MASRQLEEDGRHPFEGELNRYGLNATPWVRGCWRRYLNSRKELLGAIKYVESNPIRMKLPRQRWLFVTPFTDESTLTRTASGAAK